MPDVEADKFRHGWHRRHFIVLAAAEVPSSSRAIAVWLDLEAYSVGHFPACRHWRRRGMSQHRWAM